jgi:hypothetical protein
MLVTPLAARQCAIEHSMPTVIIHPTRTPDSYITHDGPWSRSWTSASSAHTDATVTTLDQHAKRDIPEAPDPVAYVSPRHVIVKDDDHSVFGMQRPGWQRHALTATL